MLKFSSKTDAFMWLTCFFSVDKISDVGSKNRAELKTKTTIKAVLIISNSDNYVVAEEYWCN